MPHRLLLTCLLVPGLACAGLACAQTAISAPSPPPVGAPAVDATGRTIAFFAGVASGSFLPLPTPERRSAEDSSTTTGLYLVGASSAGYSAPKQVVLPAGVAVDTRSGISVAGDRVAFFAYAPGGPQIGVASVTTGTVQLFPADIEGCITLANPNGSSCIQNLHLTPDGSAVLYSVARVQSLVLLNLSTGASSRLPVYWAFLAPSAQRSVTRSSEVIFPGVSPLNPAFPDLSLFSMGIWGIKVDGSNLRSLGGFVNSDHVQISAPTVSADGSWFAFLANYDSKIGPTGTTNLWTSSSVSRMTIATNVGSEPSLSGDGSLVACVKSGQVHVMRSDGSGDRAISNLQQSAAYNPVISEDGSVVVFGVGPKNSSSSAIYAMNTDGTNLRPVYAPRGLSPYLASPLSPGSLFTLGGANLIPDGIAMPASFPAPTQLAGLSVFVNDRAVPLLSVTPWQLTAQLPQDVPEGKATIQLRFADGASTVTAQVFLFYPVFFTYPENYGPQAAAFHAGTAIPADRDHPAAAGEILEVYCTGLGPTDPIVPAGMPSPALVLARSFTPDVQIGSLQAGVLYSGLVPGYIGLYQIDVIVPSGLKSGFQSIDIGRFGEGPIASSGVFVK